MGIVSLLQLLRDLVTICKVMDSTALVDVRSPLYLFTSLCGITYYGWSDNGPIADDVISPTNTR